MSAAYLKQYTCEIIIFRMANSCRKETGHDSNGRRRFQSMNELASRIMFKTDLILNKSIIPGEKRPCYLPSAVFIALMLVGPSKSLKQIIWIKHNRVKNPSWLEANQLAIYRHGRGFELGTTENKFMQLAVRVGLELGASELQVQRPNHQATLPPDKASWILLNISRIVIWIWILLDKV